MKEPSSILPFWLQESTGTIAEATGGVVVISDSKEDLRDVEYIVQAANNFPEAVRLLKAAFDAAHLTTDPFVFVEIKKFLTKLEEDEDTK